MQDHCFAFGEGLVTALEKASHGKRRLGWLGFGSYRALSAHQIFVAFCVIFLCSCDQDVCEHDLEKEMGFGGFSLWLFGYTYLGRKSWQWVSPPHG